MLCVDVVSTVNSIQIINTNNGLIKIQIRLIVLSKKKKKEIDYNGCVNEYNE